MCAIGLMPERVTGVLDVPDCGGADCGDVIAGNDPLVSGSLTVFSLSSYPSRFKVSLLMKAL